MLVVVKRANTENKPSVPWYQLHTNSEELLEGLEISCRGPEAGHLLGDPRTLATIEGVRADVAPDTGNVHVLVRDSKVRSVAECILHCAFQRSFLSFGVCLVQFLSTFFTATWSIFRRWQCIVFTAVASYFGG